MKLGVLVLLNNEVDQEFKKVRDLGLGTCQLCCWDKSYFTEEMAEKTKNAAKEYSVEITALWCGWEGPAVWNFYGGPITLGLVPPAYRFARIKTLCKGSDFARMIGVKDMITHMGFIPENPNDPDYSGVLQAAIFVAQYCKNNGQYFLFETGQETPVTLKRLIEDTGMDNIGINLDPANLLLYGKANPVDALDIFGEYVRGVHAKDGEYPTNGRELGVEKSLGEGRVNYEMFIPKLKKLGYKGALTIEREISGEQQIKDILKGKEFLERIINGLE
ncbi:MAG TPA: sugar phosphate isomerase/epimerase [Clostridiaceae bacterium]|nr:sugar phosphate isomerase/epimerase [Clostridiaceae bacterium]